MQATNSNFLFYVLLLSLLLFLNSGCHPSLVMDPKKETLTKSMKLLDQGRVEESTLLLENLHEKYPEDDEVRVVLASAYAAMAGLKITSYYDVLYDLYYRKAFSPSKKDTPLSPLNSRPNTNSSSNSNSNSNEKPLPPSTSSSSSSSSSARHLRESFRLGLLFSEALSKFPTLSEEHEIYARQAIELLETLQKPTRAHHSYRALLRATLIGARLSRRFSNSNGNFPCDSNPLEMLERLTESDEELALLFRDLKRAFPKDKSKIEEHHERLHHHVTQLQSLIEKQGPLLFQDSLKALYNAEPDTVCGAL